MARANPAVALEGRLRNCRNVVTIGVKPNLADYDGKEKRLIREADTIYYPSTLYAELFHAMGKRIFPSLSTYLFSQDKIKQTALFQIMGIPHPRTRVFYGKSQKTRITAYFSFPFIAKIPRGSAMGRGVFLIRNEKELYEYSQQTNIAYIQEFFPSDRDLRVVVVGGKPVLAYWRKAPDGDFRSNLAVGGNVDLNNLPAEAIALAVETAIKCDWDDVGLDLLPYRGKYYIIEANMKYGREGFRHAGRDYNQMMERMLENGDL